MTKEERMFERLRHKAIAIWYKVGVSDNYTKEKVRMVKKFTPYNKQSTVWMFDELNQKLLRDILDDEEREYFKKEFRALKYVFPELKEFLESNQENEEETKKR